MFFRPLKKLIGGLAVGLALTSTSQAQDVSINFIANASLRITDGKQVLFTDFPYVSAAYGHMAYTYPFFVEQGNDVTTLITNRLTDHFDPVAFMTLDWKVIAPAEVVGELQSRYTELNDARDRVVAVLERERELDQAVSPDQEITVVMPDPIIKPDTVVVEESLVHGAMHIQAIRTESAQTEHYSYVIDWGGKKIYLSGDTGDIEHLATLPEVDIAFITPWLLKTLAKRTRCQTLRKLLFISIKTMRLFQTALDVSYPSAAKLSF